jgi:hypothetical protein
MFMKFWLQSAAVALAVSAHPSVAAPVDLVPHRAVYDLSLADSGASLSDSATSMSGRMVFEFNGAVCEGYTVNFRFVMELADSDGTRTVTDLRSTSFEDGDGKNFQFLSQTYTNQMLTDEIKGSAARENGAVKVRLVRPENASLAFQPGPIFPTDHLRRIIAAADAGEMLIEQEVFDGSETGDRVYRTTAVIGKLRITEAEPAERAMAAVRRWPVSVAYFSSLSEGDQTPEYAISFDLWENGVSTRLTMDYGDFALAGDLVELQLLPVPDC